MKQIVKLSLLVLASLAVVGCGDSGLADRISALEEKVEKSGFYAEKDQYTSEEGVTIYYNGEKLYSLRDIGTVVVNDSYQQFSFSYIVVIYDNYIIPTSIRASFFLEWDSEIMFNTSTTSETGTKNSEVSSGIKWAMSTSVFSSAKSSAFLNLLITIPGTTVPITRIALTDFVYH